MKRLLALLLLIACGVGVAWYVTPPKKPLGFSGLEFAVMTPAAAARAPLLTSRGALVYSVVDDSPAAIAGIKPGEVAAAIDGVALTSASQASDIMRGHPAGDRVSLTLFDEASGDIQPRQVALTIADAPPVTKSRSVLPPRTLAKEYFNPPSMAANAAWSQRIARGPAIRPRQLRGLGVGRCNGLALEDWQIRGHAADDTMFHIAAKTGFQHAIYATAMLNGQDPVAFIRALLKQNFQVTVITTPPQKQDAPGFWLLDFGNRNGVAGFAEYSVTHGRIAVWVAAVPATDVSWDKAQVGAIVFTLNCRSALSPPPTPMDAPAKTSVSTACLDGRCQESDFAAAYLRTLRLGYVHDRDGAVFLINPRRDFWASGAEGPGFYRQVAGANEKLEPGRVN